MKQLGYGRLLWLMGFCTFMRLPFGVSLHLVVACMPESSEVKRKNSGYIMGSWQSQQTIWSFLVLQ